jgi:hypothetical protein
MYINTSKWFLDNQLVVQINYCNDVSFRKWRHVSTTNQKNSFFRLTRIFLFLKCEKNQGMYAPQDVPRTHTQKLVADHVICPKF